MNRGDLREPIFKDDADRFRCLETLGGVLRQDQLASACLLLDVQPFSFGARNSKGQPGGRHEMVLGHVYFALQPAPQALWPFVQRSLQIPDCGWQRRRLLANGVRLRASESGARQTFAARRTPAKLSLEQLS